MSLVVKAFITVPKRYHHSQAKQHDITCRWCGRKGWGMERQARRKRASVNVSRHDRQKGEVIDMPEHIERRVLDDLSAGLSIGMRQRRGLDMITTEEASNPRMPLTRAHGRISIVRRPLTISDATGRMEKCKEGGTHRKHCTQSCHLRHGAKGAYCLSRNLRNSWRDQTRLPGRCG